LYRKIQGSPTRIRLGRAEAITVDDARKAAATHLGRIAQGENPQETRRRKTSVVTLGELWEHYLEQHAKPRKRSWKEDEQRFDRHMTGMKSRRLATIDQAEVQGLLNRVGMKSGPYEANRLRSLLHKMFAISRQVGFDGGNPVHGIERFQEQQRDRFLHADELPRFFTALATLRESNPVAADAIEFCLWTGARKGNVVSTRWPEIDTGRAVWTIPKEKSKNKKPMLVPLVAQALAILERRRAATNSEWVFPSMRGGKHVMDLTKAWKSLLQTAGIESLHLHDLRRTAGSWMAATNASLHVIGKALGHVSTSATAIYARLDLDPVREAVTKAAEAIQAASTPPKPAILAGGVKAIEAEGASNEGPTE
jgi:integrase